MNSSAGAADDSDPNEEAWWLYGKDLKTIDTKQIFLDFSLQASLTVAQGSSWLWYGVAGTGIVHIYLLHWWLLFPYPHLLRAWKCNNIIA